MDRVYVGHARQQLRGRKLTELEKGSLASVVAGAVWTQQCLRLKGYGVSVLSQLCGEEEDSSLP